jgi:O-antigen/teichoic acid export membrane protein
MADEALAAPAVSPKVETAGLRRQTVDALQWTALSQLFRQLLQFGVSILLARALTPRDFGLIGMITVFTGFAAVFGEIGFSAALIQREDVTEAHYSSVFWLNVSVGAGLFAIIIACAPFIAMFYGEPLLKPLVWVVAVNFALSPLGMVQTAMLSREMDFRRLALTNISSAVVSGVAAVTMAHLGLGVWTLAWYVVISSFCTATILWVVTGWAPALRIDISAIREMVAFSSNLLGFRVVNYWCRNGDNLIVGKILGTAPLGVYTRAYSLMLLPLTQMSQILGQVMFPALARVQNDHTKVKRVYLQSVAVIALFSFPTMAGLGVVADDFIAAVYGPKWIAVIPVFRILCIVGLLQSIGFTVGWLFQSQGRTDLMLKWGIGSGAVVLTSFVIGAHFGTLEAVATAYAVAASVILFYPSFAIPGRLVGLKPIEVFRSISSVALCTVIMTGCVLCGRALLPNYGHFANLVCLSLLGVVIYLSLIIIGQIQPYLMAKQLFREQWSAWWRLRVAGRIVAGSDS